MKKVIQGVAVAAMGLAIAGCDQYKDRPYVMSCYSETVTTTDNSRDLRGYTDEFPFHAGILPLPSPEEMQSRVGANRYRMAHGYFGLRTLTEREGRLPPGNTTVIPITREHGFLYGWADSTYIYMERGVNGPGLPFENALISPVGTVEIEHYYIDGEGELQPVNFQLTALYAERTAISETGKAKRGALLSTFIPADAKYAVYKNLVFWRHPRL